MFGPPQRLHIRRYVPNLGPHTGTPSGTAGIIPQIAGENSARPRRSRPWKLMKAELAHQGKSAIVPPPFARRSQSALHLAVTVMAQIPSSHGLLAALFCIGGLSGCSLWPFPAKERTSHVTPAKRVAAIEALGRQATGENTPDQQQLSVQLARQIQTEHDPLVREAILRAASRTGTPLGNRILLAAVQDTDPFVRQTACRLLGRRGDVGAVAALGNAAKADSDIDVRLAATRALGELGDTSAIPYLSSGLFDTDPALQFAAVESLKLASGENLGNDVGAWREWVASRGSTVPPQAAIAGRPDRTADP